MCNVYKRPKKAKNSDVGSALIGIGDVNNDFGSDDNNNDVGITRVMSDEVMIALNDTNVHNNEANLLFSGVKHEENDKVAIIKARKENEGSFSRNNNIYERKFPHTKNNGYTKIVLKSEGSSAGDLHTKGEANVQDAKLVSESTKNKAKSGAKSEAKSKAKSKVKSEAKSKTSTRKRNTKTKNKKESKEESGKYSSLTRVDATKLNEFVDVSTHKPDLDSDDNEENKYKLDSRYTGVITAERKYTNGVPMCIANTVRDNDNKDPILAKGT